MANGQGARGKHCLGTPMRHGTDGSWKEGTRASFSFWKLGVHTRVTSLLAADNTQRFRVWGFNSPSVANAAWQRVSGHVQAGLVRILQTSPTSTSRTVTERPADTEGGPAAGEIPKPCIRVIFETLKQRPLFVFVLNWVCAHVRDLDRTKQRSPASLPSRYSFDSSSSIFSCTF